MPTKVLFTVLNWGLGHASRSIPIIKALLSQNIPIVFASDGEALILLRKEFPNQAFETLPAYDVHYAEDEKNFDKTIFLQLNKIGKAIKEEHKLCERLIEKHQITHIISDNRYGCYNKNIPSVIVCHQLTLQHKNFIAKKTMNSVHFKMLSNFDKIWIPDFEGEEALAGNISKTTKAKLHQKVKYIGALSRMKKLDTNVIYDYCFVLSGPEPQRTLLENIFIEQMEQSNKKTALVRGISSHKNKIESSGNLSVFNLLGSEELNELICQSKVIFCRAGYSSIMDLAKLEKPAVLIPTPGQTEQEYLAQYLAEKNAFVFQKQEEINMNSFDTLNHHSFPKLKTAQLEKTITNFLTNFVA